MLPGIIPTSELQLYISDFKIRHSGFVHASLIYIPLPWQKVSGWLFHYFAYIQEHNPCISKCTLTVIVRTLNIEYFADFELMNTRSLIHAVSLCHCPISTARQVCLTRLLHTGVW